ncbi:MAG: helix-turn-helix domain-containing protein [Prevotellaceae bacterium]|nr:helix-turn-helix domain-containing protein [Prevotellaceae bacterium]
MDNKLTDLCMSDAKMLYQGSSIDDDLILIDDFTKIPKPDRPRRSTCIIVGLCLQGSGEYTTNTVKNEIHTNDVLIINDGQVIDDYKFNPDANGVALLMSYNFYHEIVQGVHELSSLFLFSQNHPVSHLLPNEVQSLMEYFNLIKEKVNDVYHHCRRDVVRSLIAAMIYDMNNAMYRIQLTNDKKLTRAEAIFAQFISLVEQHYHKERRVGWYSKQMCITAKYLSETVKQVSRRTPNDWIDNYVIVELRVQLRNTTKSIKEIAQDMNFPNQSFLGKFFKEHVGMSPLAYRKTL